MEESLAVVALGNGIRLNLLRTYTDTTNFSEFGKGFEIGRMYLNLDDLGWLVCSVMKSRDGKRDDVIGFQVLHDFGSRDIKG